MRIQLPLGPKFSQKYENFRENGNIFVKMGKFLRKCKNLRENFVTKIDAYSGIIIDVEYRYLGNGASDRILFTKVGILK
jgi:hypothetical protein